MTAISAGGAPTKQDSHSAHGEPLGEEEIKGAKKNYGFPIDQKFYIPDGVIDGFKKGIGARGATLRGDWMKKFDAYSAQYPAEADQLYRMQHRELPLGWDKDIPTFPADPKGMAGRDASGKVLNAIAKTSPG